MRHRLLLSILGVLLTATVAHAQRPGTPFTAPPPIKPTLSEVPDVGSATPEAFVLQLPIPVFPGYVVLTEPGSPVPSDPQFWSDVVIFRQNSTGTSDAILVSGAAGPQPPCDDAAETAGEPGVQDSDLAPYGVTTADIVAGNTVYLAELPQGNSYVSDPPIVPPGDPIIYSFRSDVVGLYGPGAPRGPVPPNFPPVELREGPEPVPGGPPSEHAPSIALPFPATPGFVVLLDVVNKTPTPHDWSDIAVFECDPATGHSTVYMLSDPPGENGFDDAYLAAYGLTTAQISQGRTAYILEGTRTDGLNDYVPVSQVYGTVHYYLFSDNEGVTKAQKSTWGRLRQLYK